MNIKECLLSNDENNPIKSATTVKYQMVRSPTNFVKLQCNTNLNIPPKNWLNSSINSYGLQPALSQSTGFSRFLLLLLKYFNYILLLYNNVNAFVIQQFQDGAFVF